MKNLVLLALIVGCGSNENAPPGTEGDAAAPDSTGGDAAPDSGGADCGKTCKVGGASCGFDDDCGWCATDHAKACRVGESTVCGKCHTTGVACASVSDCPGEVYCQRGKAPCPSRKDSECPPLLVCTAGAMTDDAACLSLAAGNICKLPSGAMGTCRLTADLCINESCEGATCDKQVVGSCATVCR